MKATVTGDGELRAISIDPSVVDPDDVETLEDLVVAAVLEATRQAKELQAEKLGAATGGLDLDVVLGGLDGLLGLEPVGVYEGPVQALIDELGRLPGVGPKSAQRIAFYLLQVDAGRRQPARDARSSTPRTASRGAGAASTSPKASSAPSAATTGATRTCVCVVEEPRDIVAIERTGEFNGRYHVLQGAISPIEGIGPEQLRVKELLARIGDEDVNEVILATNPNIEGEATAMYLARLLKPLGLRVTRIASGLPVGGDLEYADEVTLGRALEGRREVDA